MFKSILRIGAFCSIKILTCKYSFFSSFLNIHQRSARHRWPSSSHAYWSQSKRHTTKTKNPGHISLCGLSRTNESTRRDKENRRSLDSSYYKKLPRDKRYCLRSPKKHFLPSPRLDFQPFWESACHPPPFLGLGQGTRAHKIINFKVFTEIVSQWFSDGSACSCHVGRECVTRSAWNV